MKSHIFTLIFSFSLIAGSKAQELIWGGQISADYKGCNDMVVDKEGNLYVTGSFIGIVDFDLGPGIFNLNSPVSEDIFVCKYDSSSNLVWAVQAGSTFMGSDSPTDQDVANGICVDSSGNVYVTGWCTDDVMFGSTVETGVGDEYAFVSKLNATGSFMWAKFFKGGGLTESHGNAIAVNTLNQIYTTGYFNSSSFSVAVDFDPGPATFNLVATGSSHDIFVSKLDSMGNFIMAVDIGASGDNIGYSIQTDSLNNFYLVGNNNSASADVDPGAGTYSVGTGAFIVKWDSSENIIWAFDTGVTSTFDKSLVLDKDLNVYVCGYFSVSSDLDPGPGTSIVTATGLGGTFLQKFDNAGNFLWVKVFQGDAYVKATSIDVDLSSNIYLSGYFNGTADFDPGIGDKYLTCYPGIGGYNHFLLKLNESGDLIWVQNSNSDFFNKNCKIKLDANKNIYYEGSFQDTSDFDFGYGVFNLYPISEDNFICKYKQGPCSDLTLIVDSVKNVACTTDGFGLAYASNGILPYSYEWAVMPTVYDSVVVFTSGGIYDILVTDSIGCQRSVSVLVGNMLYPTDYDLTVNLISTPFTPGFNSLIWLDAFNNGCDTTSGVCMLILDSLVTYDSASAPPDYISGDTLFWNFDPMNFDSLHFSTHIFVTTSTTAALGDTALFNIVINPILGDANTTNNAKIYKSVFVGGYDPNDKQVYPQGECTSKYVLNDEKLTYTIRFQNTGTADAINIYLLDTLDPNLDLNSVRVVGNSHYVITEVLPGNVLKFRFDNIYLPDSTSDEPNSHGYVIYEVDALPSVPNNTVINNTAHIFFDFNPAVVTNTVSSLLVDSLPVYNVAQNINITCGDDYTFPDGTIITDIGSNITHTSIFSPLVYCDSVITTNIIVDPLDITVVQTGSSFTANATGVTYQWINCSLGYTPISGETNQNFTTGFEGAFAVIVTNGTCSDTSVCYTVGAVENLNSENSISIYPNPTNFSITISTQTIAEKIILKDVFGRTIKIVNPTSQKTNLDVHELASGVYFVSVLNDRFEQTVKIVKE